MFFAKKCWVNPNDIDSEKEYEQEDFLRVWYDHDVRWNFAENGPYNCAIYSGHKNE